MSVDHHVASLIQALCDVGPEGSDTKDAGYKADLSHRSDCA